MWERASAKVLRLALSQVITLKRKWGGGVNEQEGDDRDAVRECGGMRWSVCYNETSRHRDPSIIYSLNFLFFSREPVWIIGTFFISICWLIFCICILKSTYWSYELGTPDPRNGEMLMFHKPHTLKPTDTHTMSSWGHVNTSFYSPPYTIMRKEITQDKIISGYHSPTGCRNSSKIHSINS